MKAIPRHSRSDSFLPASHANVCGTAYPAPVAPVQSSQQVDSGTALTESATEGFRKKDQKGPVIPKWEKLNPMVPEGSDESRGVPRVFI